jgi:glucose/arabinose dehydrogenase
MSKHIAKKIVTGFSRPDFAVSPPGDKDRLVVIEQKTGNIRSLRLATGKVDARPFRHVAGLDIPGNEQGLLGLAFAPDYATSGFLYVNITEKGPTGTIGPTAIRRSKVSATNLDQASATTVISIPQPFSNYNGGWIAFGPNDKFLYTGVGDGGSEGNPNRTAQNPKLLLRKMLRINVSEEHRARRAPAWRHVLRAALFFNHSTPMLCRPIRS